MQPAAIFYPLRTLHAVHLWDESLGRGPHPAPGFGEGIAPSLMLFFEIKVRFGKGSEFKENKGFLRSVISDVSVLRVGGVHG
jgi:hypothetical protein